MPVVELPCNGTGVKILSNYLRRESLKTVTVIFVVLFLITLGTLFADTLRAIARGALPASMLFTELGLRTASVLTILLPLAFFLGVLSHLSGMYRNQEAVMYHAFGLGVGSFLRFLMPLGLAFAGGLLVLSLWVVPWASRQSDLLAQAARKDISVLGLKEGEFQSLGDDEAVIYIEKIDSDNNRFERIFLARQQPGTVDVLTASHGYQFEDDKTHQRYLALFDGHRSEGRAGQLRYQRLHFERADVKLPRLQGRSFSVEEDGKTLRELLASTDPKDRTELHWRLVPPLSVLVLLALAVALARTSHREGKYGNLMIGLLAYVAYVNFLALGRALLEQGKLPFWLGLWWVHAAFLGFALWRIWKMDGELGPFRARQLRPC